VICLVDGLNEGFQKIILRTVDTCVVVLTVAAVVKNEIKALWVPFQIHTSLRD